MSKYLIVCPNCKQTELNLVISKAGQECEICSCGFPENTSIKEWAVA
jgi:uncharacterized protein YbaR (Trm112 family)